METTVTARHCDIDSELTDRARGVVDRLRHQSPHALEASVVFDRDPAGAAVEIRLHVRGAQVLVATATEPDHRTALDRAEERLRRQVTRDSAQRRARRASSKP